jgi:hypothetical protein
MREVIAERNVNEVLNLMVNVIFTSMNNVLTTMVDGSAGDRNLKQEVCQSGSELAEKGGLSPLS